MPDTYEKLRITGAVARETLKAAAAKRSGVPVADIRTQSGHVILPDGTEIPYVELSAEAAKIPTVVCSENLIRVDAVMESPKLAEGSGCSVSLRTWRDRGS